MTHDAATARLADARAIEHALYAYAAAIDTKRFEQLRGVFTADATLDFTSVDGPRCGVEDAIAWLEGSIGQVAITQHHMSNVQVEVFGDEARSRSYLYNPLADEEGAVFLVVGGVYEDRWRRTEGGWRIAERVFHATWTSGQAPTGIRPRQVS